jgi:hypothetical protein
MGMFDMTVSPEQAAEWSQKYADAASQHVDEEVVAAAPFRRGGAAASFAVSKAQLGGLVYAGTKLFQKKKSGGMPERVFLVVTPTKLRAFKFSLDRRGLPKIKDEVAVWDRAGLRFSTDRSMKNTLFTIESPAEGEKVVLTGAGVVDDPMSDNVMQTLQEGNGGAAPSA